MEQINIFDWVKDTKEIRVGNAVKSVYGWHIEGGIPINDFIEGTVIAIDDNNYTVEFIKDGVKKVTGIYKGIVKKVM